MPAAVRTDHGIREGPRAIRLVLQSGARNAVRPIFDAQFICFDAGAEDENRGGSADDADFHEYRSHP